MIEQQAHSIVVVGNMNPRIFHPIWFAKEELLPASEAENARIEVIHPDVAVFSTPWLNIQVTRQQFIANTSMQAYFEPLRDLVIGVFELLGHTPAVALGVNFEMHMPLREEKLAQLSNQMAPDTFWKERNIEPNIEELKIRIDKPKGHISERYISLTIQASKLLDTGLFLSFNNHFQLASGASDFHSARETADILKKEWDAVQKEVIEITQKIVQ